MVNHAKSNALKAQIATENKIGLMAHAVELFHQGYIDCDTQKPIVTKPKIFQIGNVTTAPI